MQTSKIETLRSAIADLRGLLGKIGRAEFRKYGYARQLVAYRAQVKALA